MKRIAIVGSGIAGLGLAYYLRNQYEITIYEQNDYAGGHSNTVCVSENQKELAIDTGFMVFNHETYPLLTKLFGELNVPTKKTDMSFSVQHLQSNLEYSGASFDRLFGNRKNILNPGFWRLLLQIDRFNQQALQSLLEPRVAEMSLEVYTNAMGYSRDLLDLYLIPMSSALWSTPPEKVMQFPAFTLLNFFFNHGLLGRTSQHQWWTVSGGAREYVRRLVGALPSVPRLTQKVRRVVRSARGVKVTIDDDQVESFDQVAFACHADEALRLLHNATDLEQELLSAFLYQRNDTLLHTDASVMPRAKRCWSSWNYRVDGAGSSTHYWMNSLQGISPKTNYFVSLNSRHLVDAKCIEKEMIYHHPLFDLRALNAQTKLPKLNLFSPGEQIFFCGSYFGYGFHEDALRSSLRLAEHLCAKVLST